nr:sensor histidine kinase [Allomuricauda sp.]
MHRFFSLVLLLTLVFPLASNAYESDPIDSLRNSLARTTDVNERILLHLSLFKRLQRKAPDSSQIHLRQAILFSKETAEDSILGKVHVAQIEDHLTNDRYDSVFQYVAKALDKFESLSARDQVDMYTMQGVAYYYRSEYAKAITSHLQAEKISTLHKMEHGKAQVLNNIGITYIKLEDWTNAEKYMVQSLDICKKFDLKRGISYTLGNLGIIYKHLGRFHDAIDAYLESNKVFVDLGDERGIARNYDNLGALYEELKNYPKALEFYQKSLKKSRTVQDQSAMASALHNLGNLYAKHNDYNKAIKNYSESLEIAQTQDYKDAIRNNYLGLSEAYESNGNLIKALSSRKLYEQWKDSVTSKEHLESISELEIKYQSEKKEKSILQLSEEKLKAEVAMAKQGMKIRRLSVGLVGAIIVFGLVFVIFRQRSKNQKQKELIHAIADTQHAERQRISQDLHDSVGGDLALTKSKLLHVFENSEENSEELQDAISSLTKTADDIRQISHNLMPAELVKFGLLPAIEATLDQLQNTELNVQLYAHEMDSRIDSTKEIYLYRIFQEVVQNVLKHAKASQLNIYLNRHKNYVNLMVEDNGVGMKSDSKKGMGLANITSRVEHLKGTLNIDSVMGRGTTMNIQIPL